MTDLSNERPLRQALAYKSPRYRRLEELESWVSCDQYEGRPSWWDDKVPQWERKPCIAYPVVRMAIDSNVDLMLGERAFPRFSTERKDEGELDSKVQDIHRSARFRSACREAFASAQGCGTACAVYGLRNDQPFADLIPAKWCEPEFEETDTFTVSRLVIQYPYLDQRKNAHGEWEVVAMVYRRVIDADKDTVFRPAEARDDGGDIDWQVESTIEHPFGFCPVVWYPFMRGAAAVNVIDGKAVHDGFQDEIQAHDIARSQWHKTSLYCDPQIVEIGVSTGHNPTGDGRTAVMPATEHGGPVHPDNPVRGHYVDGKPQAARKKGTGHVWQYPNKDTKVEVLTVSGDALKAQQENVASLRNQLQESLSVVFLDPNNIKFAATTSGKALEAIKQKQLDRVDQYREDFRDGFLLPSLRMQMRIAKMDDSAVDSIQVKWGSYQAPDFEEQQKVLELLQVALGCAKGKQLITLEVAVQKLVDSDIFEIEDISEHVEALRKEVEDAADEPTDDAPDTERSDVPDEEPDE